ncbi:hypothetical protein CHS0354_017545 [Potamilus streckersoni]|uniref:Ergosterol biosynthetic protein 28 n=1 Tax=Potamilus streckersoni TaxID=2493646 RepID=A0AAE0WDL7_9BIVA|nr:hypothetical protein CHS0354_017545 [Potamilus streckersoni]
MVPRLSSFYISTLRIWLSVLTLMAMGSTIHSFLDPNFLGKKLYTKSPSTANSFASRLYGLWNFLSAAIRFCCVLQIHNKTVYNLTVFSFLLMLGHFISEILIFKTADLDSGVIASLIISVVSILAMLYGYRYLEMLPDYKCSDSSDNPQDAVIQLQKMKRGRKKNS